MSGAAGGTRIKKENLKDTIRDYRENILKPLGLDKSYNITGVRSRPEKDVFGDIDIVLSFSEGDKKELKQNLAKFLESKEQIPIIPKKGKKYFIHGNIVSILYPISGKEGEYVQIDNIVTSSEEEGKFTYKMLDLPAQEQVMAIGLVKTIFTELDNDQIQKLFNELGLTDIEKPNEGEEYDFNLNPSGLSLRIVPIGKNEGREIWKSNKFEDIKTIIKYLGIDIEKDKFSDVIPKIKKFKNRRSIDRFKGMFAKNIRVGDTEVGTEKGTKKQQALDAVSVLENKYNSLVMSLIKPFIKEETISPQTIALMPGAFKPPHKDHLRRINAAAQNSDKALILISPLDRAKEGEQSISAEQSLAIWQLYKNKGVLAPNVEFFISQDNAPVKTAYDIATANPQTQYIGVYGKDDAARWKNLPNEKYPNLTASDFGIIADLSASDLRKALLNNEDITLWMPKGITPEEYKQTLGIETKKETTPAINENTQNPDKIPGGLAQGKNLQDIVNHHKDWSYEYLKDQLNKGIKIELEHTTSEEIAKEIAMDHLWEDPQYYTKLSKIEEMSKSNLKTVEDYADAQLNPIDVEFTNHFFDRLNDPRNLKPISIAELIGFFKRLAKNKKELFSFLDRYEEIVAKDTKTNINIPLVNDVNKIIAKTIMRKPNFYTSNPVLSFEQLNEVEISGFSGDIKKAMDLIEDESVDPNTLVKAIPPYEETKYIPLLDSGVPFYIEGKIKYKDKGEIKITDSKVYIGFATLDPNIGGLALTGHDKDKNFTGESIILINTDLYNKGRFSEIESVIVHELTHGIDPALSTKRKTRTPKTLKKSIDPEKKEYWTSSVEMIARVNEIVSPLETKILKNYQDAVNSGELTQEEFNKIKRTIVEYIIYVLINEDGKFNTRHIAEYMNKRGLRDIETQDLLNTIYEDILYRWLIYHHESLKVYNPQYPKNIIKGIVSKLKIKELVSEEQNITEYKNQDTLNPKVWENNKLKIKLREALLKVAQEFYNSLNINLPLEDVLLLGSLANYNWTDVSDIDLHLLIDYKSKKHSELLEKYFDSKKNEFNNKYNLTYQGHPIELYVQDTNDPNASQGVYSILNNKWVKEPQKENIEIDDFEIAKKVQPIMNQIDELIANPETTTVDIDKLKEKIKQFRQAGLDEKGEYSLENLAFKQLRYNGYLEKLNSLKKEKTITGFGLDTINESMGETLEQPINDLTKYALKNGYNINPLPDVIFIDNDIENANDLLGRTAYYDPNNHSITLYTLNRHPKDVLRSYAHELIHHIQNLEDRLQNISTDNINEDEYLKELEREAYEKGNLLLRGWENSFKNKSKFQNEYKQYVVTELFEKDLPNIEKISPLEYIVGDGNDIEAKYYFRLEIPEKDAWTINWEFTPNNTNQSPEAWKQVTATSFRVLNDFIKTKNPKLIYISGDSDTKTNIYKSKSFLEKLENIFNNQYKIDNTPEYSIVMKSIEQVAELGIKKRMEILNESYDQALNYWKNGDINSKSKIERWNSIKKKIKREVLQEMYKFNELIIDIPKYDYLPDISDHLLSQLHELKINEITLNPDNAVEINGDLFGGEFKVGNIEYIYSIKNMPNPYKDEGLFYNIQFDEKYRDKPSNEPTGNARENYIKILSTMYKIILDFTEKEKPKYIGISSLDKSGYRNIYNNLTKTNILPGYSRKDAGLDFTSKLGEKGKFIVLKRK